MTLRAGWAARRARARGPTHAAAIIGSLLVLAPFLLAMAPAELRYHRAIIAAAGPCRLELPDDVLDVTRPSLPDLRIFAEGSREVPFALETALQPRALRFVPKNVASSPGETTALIDRGAGATWADELLVEVKQAEFLKPVVVEASADRASWARIASASIFAVGGVRATAIHFAPSDHRYLRVIFDDRNGAPIVPVAFSLASRPTQEPRPARVLDAELRRATDAELGFVTYALALPARNLPLTELRLAPSDAIFSRKVRVFERGWFRDEASRRLLGEATIARAAGHESTDVPLSGAVGNQLEVDIERTDGPLLEVARAQVRLAPRAILFFAPLPEALELRYGSPVTPPPHYDLAAALSAFGRAPSFAAATLGPPVDEGVPAVELAAVRGGAVAVEAWHDVHTLTLPSAGTVAYLDVPDDELTALRIVDAEARQVPYVTESVLRHRGHKLPWRARREPAATVITVDGLGTDLDRVPLEAIELHVGAPAYFARDAVVVETSTDARGRSGELRLGYGHLVRSPEAPGPPLRIVSDRPTGGSVELRIDEGDNAPLVIDDVTVWAAYRRIDFAFRPGEQLRLLRNNPRAAAARYDLQLLAARVFAAPAEPASIGASAAKPQKGEKTAAMKWLWVPLVLAALVVLFALRRTLRAP